MGRGPASFSIVPGGPPGPSIGLPDACPGPSRRGRVPFCRRDSTRPQNASGLIPIPPGNGFPALLPSPLMSASPAPSFPGSPGIGETGLRDRASARIGGGSHPGALFQPRFGVRGDSRKRPAQGKQRGYSEAREAWESPVRGQGAAPRARLSLLVATGFHPRPEDRPRSADPCPGDRSLRGTSSLRAMPAAARRLILASQGHARTGPLRFFDPLPPHVGLSRLLRGRGGRAGAFLRPPTPPPGPSPGRFPSPALRRDPGKPPVEPGPAGRGFPGFAVREIARRSRICGGIPGNARVWSRMGF
jgi:hypothetical protein